MAAACKGKSKLGIPRKVACEYHRADRAKARAGRVKRAKR